ncbi:uncharacterized protein J3R85_008429 [Psidium guajava]|nr:uncharacterized protein J3R85_008429 [Psidium guajava]
MKIPVEDDDMEINSPSSVISSLCQDPEGNNLSIRDGVHVVREREIENQDEDKISGSFVIEIGASNCEMAPAKHWWWACNDKIYYSLAYNM